MPRNIEPPRTPGTIAPGWYRIRLVRNGWAVPAKIEHGPHGWRCTLDGFEKPWTTDPFFDSDITKVLDYGLIIEEWEYTDLLNLKAECVIQQPDHPCLTPMRAMDPMTLPVVRRKK